jgi:hypothetical protein
MYGRWAMPALVRAWHQVVQQEGCWHAHRYEGFRPVAYDLIDLRLHEAQYSFGAFDLDANTIDRSAADTVASR